MTKYDSVENKQDVWDYLVANKEYLAQLCADDIKDYVDRRQDFIDFLPDFTAALNEKLKARVADEVTSRLGCDRESVEIILEEVGMEWLKQ